MSKAFFIKNKACFGGFPTQQEVLNLESEGFVFFVNLTNNYERKITPYFTSKEYLQYPIKDRKIPKNNKSFAKLILTIEQKIKHFKGTEKLYLHCKGGHGRSGVAVAVLLCHMFNLSPKQSIEYTTKYHNTREMKEKWKRIGSPQTYEQKNFVYSFCKDIFFSDTKKTIYSFLRMNYPCKIYIQNIGVFNSAEEVYQYFNNPDFLYKILLCKFEQNLELYEKLLSTGLSKIYYISNSKFGVDKNKKGENILGKILCKLRNHFYSN